MPKIAPQHAWKNPEHAPSPDWPEDCLVQWGASGLVLSDKPGGSYGTAFFEAFPEKGGFIRGEGATIAEAEASALQKFRRESACEHLWGRGRYTNGGAICRRCGGFQSVFRPIHELGSHKAPLRPFELSMIVDGMLQPMAGEDRRSLRHARKVFLKARVAGIDIPETPSDIRNIGLFDAPNAYVLACRRAVGLWLKDHMEVLEGREEGAMAGLFSALDVRSLKRLLEEIEEDVENPASSPDCG
jgi:hypothetical protein